MARSDSSPKVNGSDASRFAFVQSGHDDVARYAREQQVNNVYLAHIVYLKHVAQREAERQRAEVVARTIESLGSLPIESGRARVVARLNALRRSGMAQRNQVEQVPVPSFDLDPV
jgi:hypothetical protein